MKEKQKSALIGDKKDMNKINQLINEIKTPKSNYNSFGKYHYRSNEDIQSALKPLLLKYELTLDSHTEIKELAGALVIGVHLSILQKSEEGKENVILATGDGYAVVDLNKKGMDMGQATGAATSYASKYAFGQLLLIDDNKDNDSLNNGNSTQTKKEQQKTDFPPLALSELKKKVADGLISTTEANSLVKQGKVDMKK